MIIVSKHSASAFLVVHLAVITHVQQPNNIYS